MSDVEQAKQVLEAEREAVLAGLRRIGRREKERRRREMKRWEAVRQEIVDLLRRGKAAHVSMVDMTKALGISRQRGHMLIREMPGFIKSWQEERLNAMREWEKQRRREGTQRPRKKES